MASSQKSFYFILGGIVVVGAGILIYTRMQSSATIAIPVNALVTTADTAGFHGYTLGSPSAPVEITEYGDLECPVCATFATVQFPDVKARLIDSGKVFFRYKDFPLDGPHKHPRVSAHAAACAADQGKYWPVHDMMFQQQTSFAMADNPIPPLKEIMKSAGVDVDTWMACMKSAKYTGRIQAAENEAMRLGVQSTPTFLIDGHLYENMGSDQMVHIVDSLIALHPAAKAPASK